LGDQSSSRKVRVKAKLRYFVQAEEAVFGVATSEDGYFKLMITFYEEIPGGRTLRPVIVVDRFDDVKMGKEMGIKGKRAYVEVLEGMDVFKALARRLRTPLIPQSVLPLLFDIKVVSPAEIAENNRSFRGFANAKAFWPNLIQIIEEELRDVRLEVNVV
jgi:hypothetical protein